VTVPESLLPAVPALASEPFGASPTLADVARLAGFSTATVSRVLTGSARVRPQTRRQIEQAVAHLSYVRNRAPRGANTRRGGSGRPARAGSIAFVVCEDIFKFFAEPFFARMLLSVSQTLNSMRDIQLALLTLHSSGDYHTVVRYLQDGHVDGALMASMHWRTAEDLAGLGIPLVLIGRPQRSAERFSYIDADNVGGAALAVDYLLKQGRTTIATIAGPPDMAPGADRLLGYRKAMAHAVAADPGLVAYGDFSRQSGEHAMSRLIDHRPGLDAVFVASDLMAAGAIHALHRLGRLVPDDVAVIGFEDSPLARRTHPALSTVHQPTDAMATRATRELLGQLTAPERDPVHVILDTKLVLRAST
jgi:DNA-binding LacI/PurR family transcriptional regulator